MLCECGNRAELHVRDRADVESNPRRYDLLQKSRILDGAKAVTDAARMELLNGETDEIRASELSGVWCEGEAAIPRDL